MKAMQTRKIGETVDTNLLSGVFYGNQFPVTMPAEKQYEAIEKFVNDETMVTKDDSCIGVYEVGFEKQQLRFIQSLMESFDMEEFSKMKPSRIMIQKTGIGRADNTDKEYGICPSNCVRFVLNYRKPDARGQVGFVVRVGTDDSKLSPPGVLYTSRPFATVLQRNYSALKISSGKHLMNSHGRECAQSFFIIADLYAPSMLIMKIVNNTAGVKPIDFNKLLSTPAIKNVVTGITNSVSEGKMDMDTGMEMIKKIMAQKGLGAALQQLPVARDSVVQDSADGI